MPHTIMDLNEPLKIPAGHIAWGYIRNAKDLARHSISIKALSKIDGKFNLGAMRFKGNGAQFVQGL